MGIENLETRLAVQSCMYKIRFQVMSQNTRKQEGGPKVAEGFPLWRNQTAPRRIRHLEFKAGKMFVRENMVHPDHRKGLVYIDQDDEGMMHFCWMDRSQGVVEDDLITMPADCFYKRIDKCTTGRVYMLKMKSSSITSFYWMQEPSAANDLQICNEVNSLLNFPPARMLLPEQIFNNELHFILNQLNSEQLLHALYNGEDFVVVDTRNQPVAAVAPVEEETSEQPPLIAPPPPPPDPYVNLGEVINAESVKMITNTPALMKRLGDQLPPIEGEQNNTNLEETVKSHQFKHAIEDFSMALKRGTSGNKLRELNVNKAAVAAADKGDVDSFIKALQGGVTAAAPSQTTSGPSPPGPGTGHTGGSNNKAKDPRKTNSGKDGEGIEKDTTHHEEQQNKSKRTSGDSKKRTYDSISKGVNKVNSAQQTDPIRITSPFLSVGPETKIARRFGMSSVPSDNNLGLEKSQNTDPVQIEELSSSTIGYDWIDHRTSGSSISRPSYITQQNVQQTQRPLAFEINGGLESVELSKPDGNENIQNKTKMTNEDEKNGSTVVTDKITGNIKNEIVLENEYQQDKREAMKRVADMVDTIAQADSGTKRMKLNQPSESTPKQRSIEEPYQIETRAMARKRASLEIGQTEDHAKDVEIKRIKLNNRNLETTHPGRSTDEIQNGITEESRKGVNKVEGEQQTEPVRIKSAPSAGNETKITKKRPSARGPRNDGSMERSQNTDPVLIEEAQKRQRHKDPKPPGQE